VDGVGKARTGAGDDRRGGILFRACRDDDVGDGTASLRAQRSDIGRPWSTVNFCRTVRRRASPGQMSALCAPGSVSRNGGQSNSGDTPL
jgi:hypothetical protein